LKLTVSHEFLQGYVLGKRELILERGLKRISILSFPLLDFPWEKRTNPRKGIETLSLINEPTVLAWGKRELILERGLKPL